MLSLSLSQWLSLSQTVVLQPAPGRGSRLLQLRCDDWSDARQLELAWLLLSVPVLVAGFVRLRGWRPRRWVRAAAWAGSWVAGLALMGQAADWVGAGLGATRGVLSVRELAICAAWLLLGGAMTWILAVPPARRSDVPSTSGQASGNGSPHVVEDPTGIAGHATGVGQPR